MNLLSQRNSREKEIILPPDVLSRTGGDYYGEENYITLPEIIVTPDGNYWEGSDNWNDYDPNDPRNNDWNNPYDDDWTWGNGGHSNTPSQSTEEQQISRGMRIASAIQDSINNKTAVVIEKATDSNIYKAVNIANYGANFAIAKMDVYSLITNNKTVLKSLGGAFGGVNAGVGAIVAYMALDDGNITQSDIWGAASAFFGVAGFFIGLAGPPAIPIALACDGLSIIFGAVSLATSNDNTPVFRY